MSGAVNKVWTQVRDDTVGTVSAVPRGIQALSKGDSLGSAIGTSAKTAFGPGVKLIKDTVSEIKGKPDGPPAAIVPDDPVVVAAEAKKKKEAARRQAEIEILTDKPGRGGTILTDNYNYKTT